MFVQCSAEAAAPERHDVIVGVNCVDTLVALMVFLADLLGSRTEISYVREINWRWCDEGRLRRVHFLLGLYYW